jgi:guanylate kinase
VAKGKLFVLSGPSGVGKDTVLASLSKIDSGFAICITATTRAMRHGEVEGSPYTFLTRAEFEARIAAGDFLEHAEVNGGNLYGTPKSWVEATRAAGTDAILKIDVQGGKSVRQLVPDVVLVFLAPPSLEALEVRLRHRGTETEEAIQIRLEDARKEIAASAEYDYIVVNDDIDAAADRLRCILIAERCRR